MARRQLFLSAVLTVLALLGSLAPALGDAFDRRRAHRSVYGFVNHLSLRELGGPKNSFSFGSAVAISPWHVITCGHCLKPRTAPYFILHDGAHVHAAVLERHDNDDDGATVLVTDQPLETWMPLGEPHEGHAIVVTLAGQFSVRLEAPPSRVFYGWLPYRGGSGSAVVQDGRVVGLLQKKAICQEHGTVPCRFFCSLCNHPMPLHHIDAPQKCLMCACPCFIPARCMIPLRGEYSPIGESARKWAAKR